MPRVLQSSRTSSDLWLAWATQQGGAPAYSHNLCSFLNRQKTVAWLCMRKQLNFSSPCRESR